MDFIKHGIQFEAYSDSCPGPRGICAPAKPLGWTLNGEPLRCIEIHCGGDQAWLMPITNDMSDQDALYQAVNTFCAARGYSLVDLPGWYTSMDCDEIDNMHW